MAAKIPVELKNMILDLVCEDIPTLAACSLICRSWRHPAQIPLFRAVVLFADRPPTTQRQRHGFPHVSDYKFFVRNVPPILLAAVRDLKIGVRPPAAREFDEIREADTAIELRAVVRIVRSLPGLKKLSLSGVVLRFTDVPEVPVTRLEEIALQSVVLDGQSDVLRVFDVLGADTIALDITHRPMHAICNPVHVRATPPGLSSVTSLDVHGDALRIIRALELVAPPPLTSLALHIRDVAELYALQGLLRVVVPSLKRLHIDFHHVYKSTGLRMALQENVCSVVQEWRLSLLANLTDFELGIRIGYERVSLDMPVIRALLSSLPSSVTNLVLRVDFPFGHTTASHWVSLAQAFIDRVGLRRVEFVVFYSFDGRYHTIPDVAQKAIEASIFTSLAAMKSTLALSFRPGTLPDMSTHQRNSALEAMARQDRVHRGLRSVIQRAAPISTDTPAGLAMEGYF